MYCKELRQMEYLVKANKLDGSVDITDLNGKVVLQLNRENCQFLPALIRVEAMKLWGIKCSS